MEDKLFAGVGRNARVDHGAVHTAFGMLTFAVDLFERLGYEVHPTRKAEGDWGRAVFMVKVGSVPIQLTDSSKDMDTEVNPGENHIGIIVDDPHEVAKRIQLWAFRQDLRVNYEAVPGGKFFVNVIDVIMMPIELVPAFKPCPECNATGEVVRGSEGRGFQYTCPTCQGNKTVAVS